MGLLAPPSLPEEANRARNRSNWRPSVDRPSVRKLLSRQMASTEEIANGLLGLVRDHGLDLYTECLPIFVSSYINTDRRNITARDWPGLEAALEASGDAAEVTRAIKDYIDNNQ